MEKKLTKIKWKIEKKMKFLKFNQLFLIVLNKLFIKIVYIIIAFLFFRSLWRDSGDSMKMIKHLDILEVDGKPCQ